MLYRVVLLNFCTLFFLTNAKDGAKTRISDFILTYGVFYLKRKIFRETPRQFLNASERFQFKIGGGGGREEDES